MLLQWSVWTEISPANPADDKWARTGTERCLLTTLVEVQACHSAQIQQNDKLKHTQINCQPKLVKRQEQQNGENTFTHPTLSATHHYNSDCWQILLTCDYFSTWHKQMKLSNCNFSTFSINYEEILKLTRTFLNWWKILQVSVYLLKNVDNLRLWMFYVTRLRDFSKCRRRNFCDFIR